jgi:fatty-acyl-CoA synthase
VVLVPGTGATGADICAQAGCHVDEGRISKYAIPDEVRFESALPRTSVGKINRKDIREQVAGQAPRGRLME